MGLSEMELLFLRRALRVSSEDEVLILRQRTRRMIPVGARRCSCILVRELMGGETVWIRTERVFLFDRKYE